MIQLFILNNKKKIKAKHLILFLYKEERFLDRVTFTASVLQVLKSFVLQS